jgi:hypothetical protein
MFHHLACRQVRNIRHVPHLPARYFSYLFFYQYWAPLEPALNLMTLTYGMNYLLFGFFYQYLTPMGSENWIIIDPA